MCTAVDIPDDLTAIVYTSRKGTAREWIIQNGVGTAGVEETVAYTAGITRTDDLAAVVDSNRKGVAEGGHIQRGIIAVAIQIAVIAGRHSTAHVVRIRPNDLSELVDSICECVWKWWI